MKRVHWHILSGQLLTFSFELMLPFARDVPSNSCQTWGRRTAVWGMDEYLLRGQFPCRRFVL